MVFFQQMHVASIRNSGYMSWILKASFRTHKDSVRVTFAEAN